MCKEIKWITDGNYRTGFITFLIEHPLVDKVVTDFSASTATIHMKNGNQFAIQHKIKDQELDVYQGQFGLEVSLDATKLFIQSWERGLFAYDIDSKRVLWRAKLTRVNHVIALEKSIVCSIDANGLRRIDLETGAIIDSLMCGEAKVFPLNRTLAFIGPHRRKWKLIDLGNFSTLQEWDHSEVDVNFPPQFMLLDASMESNKIIYTGYDHRCLLDSSSPTGYAHFKRELELRLPTVG